LSQGHNPELIAGFGVLLGILTWMGAGSYYAIHKLSKLSEVADRKATARFLATSVHVDINNEKSEIRTYILTGDEGQLGKIAEAQGRIAEDFTKIGEIVVSEEGKRLSAELRNEAGSYGVMVADVAQLRRAGKSKEATDLLFNPEHIALRNAMDKTVADFVEVQNKLQTGARAEQAAAESNAVIWAVGLGFVGMAIGLGVAIYIARTISTAVSRMAAMIHQIAANNLTVADIEITSQDELGQAGAALNKIEEQPAPGGTGHFRHCHARGERQRAALQHQPADHGEFGRNLGTSEGGFQCDRAGQPEPADRRHRRGGDEFEH
jgi:methyl-accepting chemotaxis protein